MQVIPAVDVLEGRVVRLLRGDYEAVTEYGDDPVAAVQRWVESGADLVHVVDLGAARSGEPDPELWGALGRAALPVQVGGGIRSAAAGVAAIAAGVERVVVGSAAVSGGAVVAQLVDAVGGEAVVGAIDVREGRARGSGWRDGGRSLAEVVGTVATAGAARALVTGIDRDGSGEGPDLALLETVRSLAPGLGLIASGGVGSLADVTRAARSGAEAVIVGRALYDEVFTLEDAIIAGRVSEA